MDRFRILSLFFFVLILYSEIVLELTERGCTTLKKDMTRVLVESLLRRTLKNIQDSPERATRNLIDMGLQFSNGRFQKKLFHQAQTMLQNQSSAYYNLVNDIVSTVDHNILATFGVNLGYNSCTKGARLIREIEAQRHFNIPWALNLMLQEEKLTDEPDFYADLLQQGTALGIYTYLLFIAGDPARIIPLLQGQPDCAFILLLDGCQISPEFLEQMKPVKHAMISVTVNDSMSSACQRLREARRLYAVHQRYTEQDRGDILNGTWLEQILPAHPAFAFLRADFSCSPQVQHEVYQYITNVRNEQRHPVLCMEIRQDSLAIDQVISDGECLVGFGSDGSLHTHKGIRREKEYNIFQHSLEDILLRQEQDRPCSKSS